MNILKQTLLAAALLGAATPAIADVVFTPTNPAYALPFLVFTPTSSADALPMLTFLGPGLLAPVETLDCQELVASDWLLGMIRVGMTAAAKSETESPTTYGPGLMDWAEPYIWSAGERLIALKCRGT